MSLLTATSIDSIGLFLLGRHSAQVLSNLGALCSSRGYYAKAELFYRGALKVREKSLGLEHPDVAENLYDLASVYYDAGDYAKAEPLYQRALRIGEKAFGTEHPGITTYFTRNRSGSPSSAHTFW